MGPPLLSVRNLRTHFRTTLGTVHAVDDVSFDIHRGEVVGLVGESGCGKSITARSILGIVPPPGAVVDGNILYSGGAGEQPVDLARLNPKSAELRHFRGQEIAMIFQEPMSALSPVHTVGRSAHRGDQAVPHRRRRCRGAGTGYRAAAAGRDSESGEADRRLRVRVERGHAAAGADRHCDLRRAAVADRRRAHHRHRRHHPGQGAGAAQGAAGADRDGDSVHHPQPRGDRGAGRPGERDVPGPHRGERLGVRPVRRSPASLLAEAAAIDSQHRGGARLGAADHRGIAAPTPTCASAAAASRSAAASSWRTCATARSRS